MVYKKTFHNFNFKSFASWAAGIILTIVILFQAVEFLTTKEKITINNSIAILPFENITANEEYNWLTKQFLQTLTFKLGDSNNFEIIDQHFVINLLSESKAKHAGYVQLGKNLNTNYILHGSYTIMEDEIQILTMLTNVQTGQLEPILSQYYDKEDKKNMWENLSNTVFEKLESIIVREDS